MGVIVSGFSNIGKSYIKNNNVVNCIDLDSHYFNKVDGWISVYVDCLLSLKETYDYVFITTHGDILNELNKRNIEYYLVYPERDLKEEYRKRAINRGSDKEFVEGFFKSWDRHIDDCIKNKCKNKIVLKSNEYLSDVIKYI